MDRGRTIKEVFESKAEGSRRMGRPRLRCVENTEKNVRDVKFQRERQKEAGREEGTSLGSRDCQRAVQLSKEVISQDAVGQRPIRK
jgi:hypothetical protein